MSKALFISMGGSAPAWYRCGLVANELQQDWGGFVKGPPPYGALITGNINHYPEPEKYDVVVIQQARGEIWERLIKDWQEAGTKVLYEIDDFVHGVKKVKDHRFQGSYPKKVTKAVESCMALCDGIICSTDFLASQYKKYNENIFVCKVGIDTWRYENKKADRQSLNIGWAGGTGHHLAVGKWLEGVSSVLEAFSHTSFVSIGTDYASALAQRYPHRTISIPWVAVENLPHALSNIDIAIAPSHESKYHLSKSDLRWLEAGACGIPVVASPEIYPDIKDGVTGKLVNEPSEVSGALTSLIMDNKARKSIGENAQKEIQTNRDISVTSDQWLDVFNKIV
jgi:glycosyltransferase involved in cell wall biosynthesis